MKLSPKGKDRQPIDREDKRDKRTDYREVARFLRSRIGGMDNALYLEQSGDIV